MIQIVIKLSQFVILIALFILPSWRESGMLYWGWKKMTDSCKIPCWLKVNADIFFLPEGKQSYMYGNMYLLETGMERHICQSISEQKETTRVKQCVKHWIEPCNRFQSMYVRIKSSLTTSCLIISSLSLNLSCRQFIRCVSSGLDSHFFDFSSNSLSLYQRKYRPEKKFLRLGSRETLDVLCPMLQA